MTIRLNFIRETEKARLYKTPLGEFMWIPKSVVKSTVKFLNAIHELNIEDWWWEKNLPEGWSDDDIEDEVSDE